jgi:hypothetical protein
MTEERKLQIPVEVDATGAKQGFGEVKSAAQDMAQAVQQAGARRPRASTASVRCARRVAEAGCGHAQHHRQHPAHHRGDGGGRPHSAKYFEALAAQRGVDVDALKPYLAQLDAVAPSRRRPPAP